MLNLFILVYVIYKLLIFTPFIVESASFCAFVMFEEELISVNLSNLSISRNQIAGTDPIK